MLFYTVPSVDEMETLVAGSAKKPPKPKPPCKWGPRTEDGFCPTKPLSDAAASGGGGSASARPCKYGARDAAGNCPKKPAAQKAPCKYGPRSEKTGLCPKKSNLEKLVTKNVNIISRNVSNAAVDIAFDPAARAAVKAGIGKMTDAAKEKAAMVGASIVGLGAAGAAGVMAAGVTAFLATSYLKGKVQEIMDNRMKDQIWKNQQKRVLVQNAWADMEKIVGGDLTPHELALIHNKVMFPEDQRPVPPQIPHPWRPH